MNKNEISPEELMNITREGLDSCPFHKILGLKYESLTLEEIRVRLDMQKQLVGNPKEDILHGGVICSVLDAAGSLLVTAAIFKEMKDRPIEEAIERYSKLGKMSTIDLRIDYLMPGRGKYFLATGSILRLGAFVAVARMELHNDQNTLIAVGTGTYKTG
jgi:uncharacterized protein (TIGR00369 family)